MLNPHCLLCLVSLKDSVTSERKGIDPKLHGAYFRIPVEVVYLVFMSECWMQRPSTSKSKSQGFLTPGNFQSKLCRFMIHTMKSAKRQSQDSLTLLWSLFNLYCKIETPSVKSCIKTACTRSPWVSSPLANCEWHHQSKSSFKDQS